MGGMHGGVFRFPPSFSDNWWERLQIPETTLEVRDPKTIQVLRGENKVSIWVRPIPALNNLEAIFVHTSELWPGGRNENVQLADEIITALVGLGAARLEHPSVEIARLRNSTRPPGESQP